jgi:hypothetical protein
VVNIIGCTQILIIYADGNDIIMKVDTTRCGWGTYGAAEVGEASIRSVPKGMQRMARCTRPMRLSSEFERFSKCERASVQFCSNDEPLRFKIPNSQADRRAW